MDVGGRRYGHNGRKQGVLGCRGHGKLSGEGTQEWPKEEWASVSTGCGMVEPLLRR